MRPDRAKVPDLGSFPRSGLLARLAKHPTRQARHEFEQRYHDLLWRFATRQGLEGTHAHRVARQLLHEVPKILRIEGYDPATMSVREFLRKAAERGVRRALGDGSTRLRSHGKSRVAYLCTNDWAT